MNNIREQIKDKKRIVVKIGSSSLQHAETGDLDYIRLEKLVRELCDISNQGKEVVLVTSGAIAAGKQGSAFKDYGGADSGRIHGDQAGLFRHRPGKTDDDLPEAFCGVQSGGSTDPDDEKYHRGQSEPLQCP